MVNELIEQIYKTGKVQDAAGNEYPIGDIAVRPERGRRLYDAVKAEQAKRTLEVGGAWGLSMLHICQALLENGGGGHTLIDPFQQAHYHNCGLMNARRAGFEGMVNHYANPSQLAMPELWRAGLTFDFIYIDGSHLYDDSFVDMYFADKLIKLGGVIALDDLWMASQRKMISFWFRNLGYEMVYEQPVSAVEQAKRRAKALIEHPADVIAAGLPCAMDRDQLVFLRKVAEDTRHVVEGGWKHYVSF